MIPSAHEQHIGVVKAVHWPNQTEHGTRSGVTFSRLYRDGERWKSTDSFSRDGLLVLAKIADRAHSWIVDEDKDK